MITDGLTHIVIRRSTVNMSDVSRLATITTFIVAVAQTGGVIVGSLAEKVGQAEQ